MNIRFGFGIQKYWVSANYLNCASESSGWSNFERASVKRSLPTAARSQTFLAIQAGRRASGFCDNFYGPKRCFLRYRSHNVQLHSRSAEEFDLGLGGTTGNLRV